MFEIKNVTKKYGEKAVLHDVSLVMGKGMNFIAGASGSGKTTLLKIMSGMEEAYEGDVFYCGKTMKHLTTDEKSYYYRTVFGFVWQNFNLLEQNTVLENMRLPGYLKPADTRSKELTILKELKIAGIADKKVKYLSGGQKQRVAIARELMKNPQVIIADEPTSALDAKTSKMIMDILRQLAKTKTVVVVTHDTSFITAQDTVFELDKGVVTAKTDVAWVEQPTVNYQRHILSLKNAFKLAKTNCFNAFARFMISMLTLMLASVLLLTTLSGAVTGSGEEEFKRLYNTYGDSLTDIGLYGNFTNAAGTSGEEDDKPNGDVNQDISGLYDTYAKDKRVKLITYLQAFNDINITLDGKQYQVESTGSAPTINKIIKGKMPMGKGKEVLVPESFVKKLNMDMKDVIGKEITFHASIYNWSSGEPVPENTSVNAIIVGVMDTTVHYDNEGEDATYTVDDSFIFSKAALEEMGKHAAINVDRLNFLLRANTPANMIAIKDELNEKGFVPIGQFELVEDMVRLQDQTNNQSGAASSILAMLALLMIIAIFAVTAHLRKREYAIYKVSGFHNRHLHKMNASETILLALASALMLIVTAPLFDLLTKKLFQVEIANMGMMKIAIGFIFLLSMLVFILQLISYRHIKPSQLVKSGNRT